MKVKTWVETAQEVEVEVSFDDVMAEIANLEAPARNQEALRLLSLCLSAVMKVPDTVVAEMNDAQRTIVASRMSEQAARYMPSICSDEVHDYPACALFRGGKCSCDAAETHNAEIKADHA